jgi:hypothetical protein
MKTAEKSGQSMQCNCNKLGFEIVVASHVRTDIVSKEEFTISDYSGRIQKMAAITIPTACDTAPHPAPWIGPQLTSPSSALPKFLCLMRHRNSGEYLQAPVVYAGPDNHFSGFRPDRIKTLAAA